MEDEPVIRSATLDAPLSLGRPGAAREEMVDRERALDRFLAGIERRAHRIASLALRDRAEAEDAVQDAMIRLVRHYAAASGRCNGGRSSTGSSGTASPTCSAAPESGAP